jgi:hypothetical protein
MHDPRVASSLSNNFGLLVFTEHKQTVTFIEEWKKKELHKDIL